MSQEPKFAVALAAFNGASWISEQIDSILNQDGVNVTIFVSIDKSNDGTDLVVREKARLDHRIVVLPSTDRFGNAARNFFRLLRDINYENFNYLALSDQDDVWLSNKLARAHNKLLAERVDAYSSNVLAFWPDGRKVLINKAQPQREWDFLFEAGGPGCTYVIKKKLAEDLKYFINAFPGSVHDIALHDWFIYAYARTHGYAWYIDKEPGLMYRQHSFNHFGTNIGWRSAKSRLFQVKSGWYQSECRKIALSCGIDNNDFVRSALFNDWIGNIFLALHIGKARRRFRDRLVLAFSCIINLF